MNSTAIIIAVVAVLCVGGAGAVIIMNSDSSDGEIKMQVTESVNVSEKVSGAATWSSNNTKIAIVSDAGIITALNEGNCTITAKEATGKTTDFAVKVLKPSSDDYDVEIIQDDMTLALGQSYTLTAYVEPSTFDQKVSWTSSNTSVATIDSNGTVVAVGIGTTKITAYSDAIKDSDSVDITVTEKGGPTPPVDVDVEIVQDDMVLKVGTSTKLTAKVIPSTADQTIVWTSDNTAVAVVSSDGTVTAISVGKTEIRAINPASGEDDDIDIVVTDSGKPEPTPTREIEVWPEEVYLKPGETSDLTANQTVSWRSTNTSVATVDANGTVTAVGVGRCEIIAYTTWDSEDADVVVSDSPGPTPTGEIEIYPDELYLTIGQTSQLRANHEVTWTSTNPSVATVDAQGNVTAVAAGECEIIASNGWDREDADVVVSGSGPTPSKEVEVWPEDLYLSVGETAQLNANQEVTWTSSNPNVATVDSNGKVTAIAAGECKIIASNGWDDDDAEVTVTGSGPTPSKEVEVWPDDLYLKVGETEKLTANQDVTWTSTNPSIAKVDSNGNVTAVGKGECEIIASNGWDDEDVDVEVR